MKAELLVDIRCRVGESPLWDADRLCLWWVDIPDGKIYALWRTSGKIRHWQMAQPVCALGLASDTDLVVALADGVYMFEPDSARLELIGRPELDLPNNRLNDGKVGPDGAFWIGSTGRTSNGSPLGRLYRVTSNGMEIKQEGLHTSNGLAWSEDGRTMMHSDSRGRWIDRYNFDPTNGVLSDRTRIAEPSEADGRPDGGAFDKTDIYWSCGVSAGCINRFSTDGKLVDRIDLPINAPTMPCFGDEDMRTVFITSLHRPKDATALCGSVFALRSDAPGVAVGRFGQPAV